MAIFNSIVIGSGKGKIGNVVLTKLKGQNIVKSRNYSPANPKTVAQVASRVQMANAVMAWKFLAGFFVYWLGVAKQKESIYNAFVSASKRFFSTILSINPQSAARGLVTFVLPGSASFNVSDVIVSSNTTDVRLSTNGMVKPSDLHVRMIFFSSVSGENVIKDREVTDQK